MQELIESIETIVNLLPKEALGAKNQAIIIKTKAIELLEKEKQQLLNFNDRGFKVGRKDIAETANDYYNETFNQ